MRAVAGLPANSGASHRKSPLALAVLLHGALLFTLLHGLSPSSQRAAAHARGARDPGTKRSRTPCHSGGRTGTGAGEQGKVVLRILIDEKGMPERVGIQQSAGFPRLDEAACSAALRAIFKPHLEDARAVPAYVLVPINFALN